MPTPVLEADYSRLDLLAYSQCRSLAAVLQRLKIETELITAIYCSQRDRLILPGSNLRGEITSPALLSQLLRDSCPHPKNPADQWAGALVCRHLLGQYQPGQQYDDLLLCEVPTDEQAPTVLTGGTGKQFQGIRINLYWPKTFKERLSGMFGGGQNANVRRVIFAAFPLTFELPPDLGQKLLPQRLAYIAFSYLGVEQSIEFGSLADQMQGWMVALRDLLSFGVLGYESENELIREKRLRRIISAESTLQLTKFTHSKEVKSLRKQADYLKTMREKIPVSTTSAIVFPKVGEFVSTPVPHYKMARYNLPSLRVLLSDPNHPTAEEAELILERLLDCLFDQVYLPTWQRHQPTTAWSQAEITKRLERLHEITKTLKRTLADEPVVVRGRPQVAEKQKSHKLLYDFFSKSPGLDIEVRYLRGATSEPPFRIDGFPKEKFESEDTFERLKSGSLVTIHGDLHFDNILVDHYFPNDPLFVLIDPRGEETGDLACDLGKLLFSCEAGYDFIDTGHFDVDIDAERAVINVNIPSTNVIYRTISGGASAAGLVSIEKSLPADTYRIYTELAKKIRGQAERLGRERLSDDTLVDRATFYEALFCLVLAESHYVQNPDGALALAARGYKILKDW